MSRVQLALRVADLEGSIAFYSRLFGAEPAKRRPGYAMGRRAGDGACHVTRRPRGRRRR